MKTENLFNDRERELMKHYYDVYQKEKEPREKLIQFISIVDKSEGKKGVESGAYMILDPVVTDEMLDLLLNMKLRVPMYIDELAKKAGKDVKETARLVDKIAHVGVLEYKPDEKGVDRVEVPIFCVGQLEQIMIMPENYDANPEESVMFEQYTTETSTGKGPYLPISNHGVHRTVPIETALTSDVKRMEWEELSNLINISGGENSYAVAECICRKANKTLDKGNGEPDFHWCLPIGHYAEYAIRTGKAKRVTKEEYLKILKKAEDRGFVHNVSNANGAGPIEYICNCDYQTCFTFRAALYTSNSSLVRSNFVAQVEPEKCVACGECVETCPMNAVKMGQRLEPKTPVDYHYAVTPHEYMKWGEERHNKNYGENRKEVWQETGTAPCKSNCPAHIAVEGYLKLAALGKYDEALELIKRNNPLPAVCGSICNRRCEAVCTRGNIDNPVAIDEVKKFLAFRELNQEKRYVPKKIFEQGKKVAIIGSGPAGLSCAYYSAVYGNNVTVFEKSKKLGGMLRYGIPSFRLEKDIIDAEIDVIKQLGVIFKTDIEVGKDVTIEELRNQGYEAFYIAIGMQGGRKFGVQGEDAKGIASGVAFMREKAEDNSVSCGENVVVVGGGNVAVDVARTAIRSGAKKYRCSVWNPVSKCRQH